jgi:hypothetical protein
VERDFRDLPTQLVARQDAAGVVQRLPQSSDEVIVVFVHADRKPDDEIAVFLRDCAIVISDSY